MTTISQYSIRAARECARRALPGIALSAVCLLAGAAASEAQPPTGGRLWAAQTGINEITLAWDSVPGTAEYRIYLRDPNATGTLSRTPTMRHGRGSRRSRLSGLQRAANGITLVAVDAAGRVLKQADFPHVTPATFFPPATPPASVTAQATSGSEVVVTWDTVPGATAYVIGRAVHRSGFSMLCSLCPAEGQYVDRNVMAGLPHKYTVAAIFPSGDVSTRVTSIPVTPGATQVVTTPVLTPTSGAPTSGAPTSGAPIVGAPPGAMPPTTTTSTATPPGVPAGTHTTSTSGYTPPGVPAGAIPPATGSTTATSTTGTITHAATSPTTTTTPGTTGTSSSGTMLSGLLANLATLRNLVDSLVAAQPSGGIMSSPLQQPPRLQALMGSVLSQLDSLRSGGGISDTTASAITNLVAALGVRVGGLAGALTGGSVVAPPSVTASATGPGAVALSWQPSPTSGITGYTLTRSLNGGAFEELSRVSPTDQSYTDQFFPPTLFSSGTVRAKYGVVATTSNGFRGTTTGEIVVLPPAPVSAPALGGGSLAACRLDFQRADNMWAAFGTPTGSLGTESITLSPGQNKVFVTDWKYEKQRNDGTNFYGSHLRIGTNSMSKTIRLHLRSWTLTGLSVLFRTGNDTFWVRLDPNMTTKFQADLMEVFCES